jgi:epoxide hydrolase 4
VAPAQSLSLPTAEHHHTIANGVRLHYVAAGDGPLVLLLHGFPEFWYSWRRQLPALAAAGYRAVAVDMRGYNRSEKPPGVCAYGIEHLVDDAAALVRTLGDGRPAAAVVGHDWGGFIAWHVAMWRPESLRRLVVLNAPHPATFLREIVHAAQLLRSRYQFYFQLPWLPELSLRAANFAILRRIFCHEPARPDAFADEDIRQYLAALRQPGALTATINYYRAAVRRGPLAVRRDTRRVTVPTLLLWGMRDRYLRPTLLNGLDRWVPDLRIERLPDATHWIQHEQPARVNQLLLEFLK